MCISTQRRAKRDVLEHYRDDHCVDHFAVETKTIIRTKDSRENGAVFLNETEVTEGNVKVVFALVVRVGQS
jgi:hypothetical protein